MEVYKQQAWTGGVDNKYANIYSMPVEAWEYKYIWHMEPINGIYE